MQHAPTVDDIELAQGMDKIPIQDGTLLDAPFGVVGEVSAAQLLGAPDRSRIEIEGANYRPHPPRRQGGQTAARADVQEGLPCKVFALEHQPEGAPGLHHSPFVDDDQKLAPVFTEREARAVVLRLLHRESLGSRPCTSVAGCTHAL